MNASSMLSRDQWRIQTGRGRKPRLRWVGMNAYHMNKYISFEKGTLKYIHFCNKRESHFII